jgi:hypothetical protein
MSKLPEFLSSFLICNGWNNLGAASVNFCGYKTTVCSNVQSACFIKPYMAINTGTFIKPTFFQRNIYTNGYHIFAAIIQVVCNIIFKTQITTCFVAQVMAVDPNNTIAKNSIKSKLTRRPKSVAGIENALRYLPTLASGKFLPTALNP